MNGSAVTVRAAGLRKTYGRAPAAVTVFTGLSLELREGDFVAVVGPSGSGKSTLLHLLAGIDTPDAGTVEIDGASLFDQDPVKRAKWRNERIGFVFQFHHLLPEFTAEENVAMPLRIGGAPAREARERARALLARVGLTDRARHLPSELSGGELQRAAVARAIARSPRVLFADEPTGNLDREHADEIFSLLRELHEERRGTSVIVTHDRDLAARCGKIFVMSKEGLRGLDV
jgi:lipoprotein-releasing system ATP-binding protein